MTRLGNIPNPSGDNNSLAMSNILWHNWRYEVPPSELKPQATSTHNQYHSPSTFYPPVSAVYIVDPSIN